MEWREKDPNALSDAERIAYDRILESRKATLEADAKAEAKQVVKNYAGEQHFRDFVADMAKHSGNPRMLKETKRRYQSLGVPVENIDIARAVADYKSEG